MGEPLEEVLGLVEGAHAVVETNDGPAPIPDILVRSRADHSGPRLGYAPRTMDRDRLRDFLKDPSTTWRWNRGEVEGYHAVELRGDELRWFRWSHDIAEGEGGAVDEHRQSVAEFLADGPPVQAPPHVVEAVRRHLEEKRGTPGDAEEDQG